MQCVIDTFVFGQVDEITCNGGTGFLFVSTRYLQRNLHLYQIKATTELNRIQKYYNHTRRLYIVDFIFFKENISRFARP